MIKPELLRDNKTVIRFDKPILGRCFSLKAAFWYVFPILEKSYTHLTTSCDGFMRDSQPPASGADQIT